MHITATKVYAEIVNRLFQMLASNTTLTTPSVAETIRSVLKKSEALAVLVEKLSLNVRRFLISGDRFFQMLASNSILTTPSVVEPIGSVLRESRNHSFPYANQRNICSFVLCSDRSVLPNASQQYGKTDRLAEEPIGSVLRWIHLLI